MIDRQTGENITGFSEYAQRVIDVLTTPLNSRVKRRGYGAKVPELLGRSTSNGNSIRLQVWTAQAFENPLNNINDGQLLAVNVSLSDVGYKLKLTLSYENEINQVNI
ncbi:MAG: hypothetical protein ACPG5R_06835 [Cognaticolwellia aestuarii]